MTKRTRREKSQGTCRLCDETGKLTFSHVVPEFMYESWFDGGGFVSLSTHPRHSPRRFEKGFREYLLCAKCEGRFARYESDAASLLRAIRAVPIPEETGIVSGAFDYAAFKLFTLSVLWRGHESRLYAFDQVQLGEEAQAIKALLLAEDPGPADAYPFVLLRVGGSIAAEHLLVPPTRMTFKGQATYYMMALGFRWIMWPSRSGAALPAGFTAVGATDDIRVPVDHQTEEAFTNDLADLGRRLGWRR